MKQSKIHPNYCFLPGKLIILLLWSKNTILPRDFFFFAVIGLIGAQSLCSWYQQQTPPLCDSPLGVSTNQKNGGLESFVACGFSQTMNFHEPSGFVNQFMVCWVHAQVDSEGI